MAKIVGRFRIDHEGNLHGPGAYWDDGGKEAYEKIMAGKDAVFNSTSRLSPDIETAILVRLQTLYAAWHGMQTFCATYGIGEHGNRRSGQDHEDR